MKGYLLDTSVVSAIAPGKPPLPPAFIDWLRSRTDRLFLSSVVVAELEAGTAKLRRAGAVARADHLSQWLDALVRGYGSRVLLLDVECGRATGRLFDAAESKGRNPGFADVAIAATASVHDLLILTRNVRHFGPLGVAHVDPFDTLPA